MIKYNPRLRVRKESFGYIMGVPGSIIVVKEEGKKLLDEIDLKSVEYVIEKLSKECKESKEEIADKVTQLISVLLKREIFVDE